MIPTNKTVEIYYLVDEFLKEYDAVIKSHSLEKGAPKKRRNRKFTMSGSEVMTILILFHFSSFRDLKHFYLFVRSRMKSDFPHTVSYNRFVELERKVCIPLAVFLKMKALGQCTGISFIDSTPIRSCHIKREKQHKTFKEFARKGEIVARSFVWSLLLCVRMFLTLCSSNPIVKQVCLQSLPPPPPVSCKSTPKCVVTV